MKYWSGQAPKPRDVVRQKDGEALAVVKELGRGKVKVSWVRARLPREVAVRDLVLLERSI